MKNYNDTSDDLEMIKEQALGMMKHAGYPITTEVEVILDENLPFMGYTTERNGSPIIVVSGDALASGTAINLLVHELSHVYRSITKHPSHDYQLLTAITAWVMHGRAVEDYQEKILHAILNHIQDLYADDISFKIFNEINPDMNLNEFFMSWIHAPHKSAKTPRKMWENADALLSTAFAQANLERHNVPDKGGIVTKATKEFLAVLDKRLVEKYDFFKKFMILLPEDVNQKDFEKILISYLSEFLKLTKPV
jgi:hypothetical protein